LIIIGQNEYDNYLKCYITLDIVHVYQQSIAISSWRNDESCFDKKTIS